MNPQLCSSTAEGAACPVPAWACIAGLVQTVVAVSAVTLLVFCL